MAINKINFFNQLDSSTKWDDAVAFNRTNPLPIDSKSVFRSVSELETYIASPLSYPGQVVVVVVSDTETTAYIINGDGTYTPVGAGISGATWDVVGSS